VAVIGAGHVGAAVANALVLRHVAGTVVLFDRSLARAEGEAWDVDDTTPLLEGGDVRPTNDYADVAGAAVVVVTVGASQVPGETRLDLLGRNASVLRSVMRDLDRVAPDAVVLLVTNPVDVLTRLAQEASTRPARLVIGSGTLLDTARLRYQLSRAYGAAPQDALVYVIGEHGDSQLAVWSGATIGGIPLAELPPPPGTSLPDLQVACEEATRRRGYAIFDRKGYTSYGVAAAVTRLAGSVVRDEQRVYPVSVAAVPAYGIGADVVLSLPCTIGRGGITRRLVLTLDASEQALLEQSAAVLEQVYRTVPAVPPDATGPAGAT
jgi:L-lactate dehydrogenase